MSTQYRDSTNPKEVLKRVEEKQEQEHWRQKWYRRFLNAWIVIFTTTVIWLVHDNRNKIKDLHKTEVALCQLRADLQQRVDGTKQFLVDHPDGIPGISAAVIKTNLTNQEKTLDSLKSLRCKGSEAK